MGRFGVTYSEEVYVDVTPWNCIREAYASYLCRHTNYRTGNFSWLCPIPPHLRIMPQLRHNLFFLSPFQLIYPPSHFRRRCMV
jgi:hypothetical protein